MKPRITAEKLREVLHYDPETGIFTWLVSTSNRVKVGQRAGTLVKTARGGPRRNIKVLGRLYKEHHLAWLYVHGVWPEMLDHKDGNGTHNWIENLRPCTLGQNNANRKLDRRSNSGYKGVVLHKVSGRWRAYIRSNGNMTSLGYFDTPELAHAAYCKAADMLHGEFSNHGTHKCATANT